MTNNTIGLSVQFSTEEEFNHLQNFLGHNILYLYWVPQMAEVNTAVVIFGGDEVCFSTGSVGSCEYQKNKGMRIVNFKDFFKTQ